MQRQWRQILPVLGDTCVDVFVATLHPDTFFRKNLRNSLSNSASIASLAAKDIRISINWAKLMRLDPIRHTYCSDLLSCCCNRQLSDAKSIEQDHIRVVIHIEQTVTAMPRQSVVVSFNERRLEPSHPHLLQVGLCIVMLENVDCLIELRVDKAGECAPVP